MSFFVWQGNIVGGICSARNPCRRHWGLYAKCWALGEPGMLSKWACSFKGRNTIPIIFPEGWKKMCLYAGDPFSIDVARNSSSNCKFDFLFQYVGLIFMDFTKSFKVVMTDLYLNYLVPQRGLCLLRCENGTWLNITRINFHQVMLMHAWNKLPELPNLRKHQLLELPSCLPWFISLHGCEGHRDVCKASHIISLGHF